MNTVRTPAPGSRRRRWLIGLSACLVLLAAYLVALDKVAERIGADVAKTMHAVPGVEDDKHRSPAR